MKFWSKIPVLFFRYIEKFLLEHVLKTLNSLHGWQKNEYLEQRQIWINLKHRMGTIWKETERLEQQIQVLKLQLMPHAKRPLNSLVNGSSILREDANFTNEAAPYLQAANYIPSESCSKFYEETFKNHRDGVIWDRMIKTMPELTDKAETFDRMKEQADLEMSEVGLLAKLPHFRGSKRFELDKIEKEKPELPPKPDIAKKLLAIASEPVKKAERPEIPKKPDLAKKPEVPKKPIVQPPTTSKSAPKRRRSSSISEQPEDKRKKTDVDEDEFEVLEEQSFEPKTATKNDPPNNDKDLGYVVLDGQTSMAKIPRIGTFYFW